MQPMLLPLASWIAVAVALIVVERVAVYSLRQVALEISSDPIVLVRVLAVLRMWGLVLSVVTRGGVVLIAVVRDELSQRDRKRR
jgi:hypothetical protein